MATDVKAPRDGQESVAGVQWLARMIDKARLKHEGTIDQFDLVFPCPMDHRLLSQLSIEADVFQQIIIENTHDGQIIEAMTAAGAQL